MISPACLIPPRSSQRGRRIDEAIDAAASIISVLGIGALFIIALWGTVEKDRFQDLRPSHLGNRLGSYEYGLPYYIHPRLYEYVQNGEITGRSYKPAINVSRACKTCICWRYFPPVALSLTSPLLFGPFDVKEGMRSYFGSLSSHLFRPSFFYGKQSPALALPGAGYLFSGPGVFALPGKRSIIPVHSLSTVLLLWFLCIYPREPKFGASVCPGTICTDKGGSREVK